MAKKLDSSFYYLAIFSAVAVVAGILLVSNSGFGVETGMTPYTLKKYFQPVKPIPPQLPGEAELGPDLAYKVCMGNCKIAYDTCMELAQEKWAECMSQVSTDVCEPILAQSKHYCLQDRSTCEYYCS